MMRRTVKTYAIKVFMVIAIFIIISYFFLFFVSSLCRLIIYKYSVYWSMCITTNPYD